jgi:hypothetical protein
VFHEHPQEDVDEDIGQAKNTEKLQPIDHDCIHRSAATVNSAACRRFGDFQETTIDKPLAKEHLHREQN